jgi:uncharacterized membrane protein (DUF4010 family)
MEAALFLKYAIALAIGTLMGMQREFATGLDGKESSAGVRTFALIGIWGCLSAHVSVLAGSVLPLASCLGILGIFLAGMYLVEAKAGRPGLTTEIASLVAFMSGVLAYHDRLALAGALGVISTAVLSLKMELHRFARNLTREDVAATLKFAILVAVFLPVLPDRSYLAPPLDVLNPHEIGLFMALMSAVGFIGYVLAKTLGAARGLWILGLMGGLVSSTAVTFGFTQRSRSESGLALPLASAILGSWSVMLARTLVVVTALNVQVGRLLWLPLGAAMAASVLYGLFLRFRRTGSVSGPAPISNPFELGPVLKFGAIFMLILTASRGAQLYLGSAGAYLSGFAAGLMDVDAVSFSMARLNQSAGIEALPAAWTVTLAVLSNTLLKGAFASIAGSRELRWAILPGFALIVVAGCVAAWIASG